MATVYKLRNKKTGLYSGGGANPRWTKQGKVWRRKADLSNHILLMVERTFPACKKDRRPENNPADWEIVELELCETAVYPAIYRVREVAARKEARDRDLKERVRGFIEKA